jgi:hypothetical protein
VYPFNRLLRLSKLRGQRFTLGHDPTHISANAPSITGGTLMKVSSSLGNLNPASLKALPKSLSFGKSIWQVLHEVPYWCEKAGIAELLPVSSMTVRTKAQN